MPRRIRLILLVATLGSIFITACTARPTPVPTPAADQVEAEEQAVYAFLLPKMYQNRGYVIMALTATGPTGVDSTPQTLEYVLQNMHDVASETVNSFRSHNEASHPLRKDLDLGSPYTLLTQEARNQIFGQNQSGWDIFYNRYPQAPGITTLSRVGFNSTLDQALVYIGTQSNWLAGAGYYVLLKKGESGWSIDQQVMTWIS